MEYCCNEMKQAINDRRLYFGYQPKYREYYINTRDSTIIHGILYCPWCGARLPEDLRDRYLEVLEKEYHIDDPWDKKQEKLIPEEFRSDVWWKRR